ncbi:hypothetical protein GCM10028784_36230 [Myceligenerans cantabricum]
MTRVLILGALVAIVCGALLGFTLAYGQWMFSIGALILGIGGATVVALAAPEPEPALAPVTLAGPVVRPIIELDDEPEIPEPAAAETITPVPAIVPLEPDRIPHAA